MVVTRVLPRGRVVRRKKQVKFLLVSLVGLICICVGLSGYVGWSLTHPPKEEITDSPANYNLAFEDIQFPSKQGDVHLKGWFLPAAQPNVAVTVILVHGYSRNRLQKDVPALPIAKSLVDAGYQVVMFDFRNSGQSEGNLTSVGQFEEQDLLGALDWVRGKHPSRIGLLGFSMGGTTSLLAAADDPSVVGVIADSPFTNLVDYLQDNLPAWSHLPNFPFTPLIMNILPPLTGLSPEKVDALSAVDRIYPRPILFIHSVDDDKIPYTNSETMWEKHKDRFEFWKTANAKHVGTYKLQPQEYTARVLDFIQKW